MFRLFVFSLFVGVCFGQCSNRTDNSCVDDCRWSDILTCCLPVIKFVSPTESPTFIPTDFPVSVSPSISPTELVTVKPQDVLVGSELNGGEISAIVIGLVVALFLLTFGICYLMKKQKSSSDPEP